MDFRVVHQDKQSPARTGVLDFGSVRVETPVFMPVGTSATVKAVPHEWLETLGISLILGNTYHLYLRPGMDVIGSAGGLHRFMSWNGAILTDSGGYQVFSHRELNRISEEGVLFRSHLDGSSHLFTPEKSIEIQRLLGSNIAMAFDDCTPYPVSHAEALASMERSMRWAARCRDASLARGQSLFGIVQGSVYPDLRKSSLEKILEIGFDGLAIGGFSVGEPNQLMHELLSRLQDDLPPQLPRYLMGVGTPLDLVRAVGNGFDMFDCVLPTRNARNGTLYTWNGLVRIKNTRFRQDDRPLDDACSCLTCRRYSRSYLRHLYMTGEILSSILNTFHNLHFYLSLMAEIQGAIREGRLAELSRRVAECFESTEAV